MKLSRQLLTQSVLLALSVILLLTATFAWIKYGGSYGTMSFATTSLDSATIFLRQWDEDGCGGGCEGGWVDAIYNSAAAIASVDTSLCFGVIDSLKNAPDPVYYQLLVQCGSDYNIANNNNLTYTVSLSDILGGSNLTLTRLDQSYSNTFLLSQYLEFCYYYSADDDLDPTTLNDYGTWGECWTDYIPITASVPSITVPVPDSSVPMYLYISVRPGMAGIWNMLLAARSDACLSGEESYYTVSRIVFNGTFS